MSAKDTKLHVRSGGEKTFVRSHRWLRLDKFALTHRVSCMNMDRSQVDTDSPVAVYLTRAGTTHAVIPADATSIYLFCFAGRIEGDGRRLGAVISGVTVDGETLEMSDPRLSHGFHNLESQDGQIVRWTNGHAVISVDPRPVERTLAITVRRLAFGGRTGSLTWHGELEIVTRTRVAGWAWDGANPSAPVDVCITANGAQVARVLANRYDADLHRAGVGNGRHRFDIDIPSGLSPVERQFIEARRTADGEVVPGSPQIIEPSNRFDHDITNVITNTINSLTTKEEQRQALQFLMAQTDLLLRRHGDFDGQRAERLASRKFRRRWGLAAETMQGPQDPGQRALVIDDRIPVFWRHEGSRALWSHMQALQRLGYAVSFAAAEEIELPARELEAVGVNVCGAPFYASVEDVLRRQDGCFDVVYLYRAEIAARYLALVRRYNPRARVIYSVADLHHVRLQRQSAVAERPELMALSRRMRLAECTAAWLADAVITHSVAEAALLRQMVPQANVYLVPWDVPPRHAAGSFATRSGVAFIGGYGHAPNVDAVHFLVETVMPLVWRTNPALECRLVGGAVIPETVTRLARPGIVVAAQVDRSGANVFDAVRLTVSPLRYGAGLKAKVLESFAAGIPCVMSPIAAEGMTLPAELQALVGKDAADLASLICRLHADRTLNEDAAATGLDMIEQRFNEEIVTKTLHAAIEGRQSVEG